MPDRSQLNAMITGFRRSAALGVAAELGISDLLADGPRTLAELAAATSSHEDTLHRLMRARHGRRVRRAGRPLVGHRPR